MMQQDNSAPKTWSPELQQRVKERAAQLHAAFIETIIEGGDFCPWAKGARLGSKSKIIPLWEHEVLAFLQNIEPADAMEVWQLVVPNATHNAMAWREQITQWERNMRSFGVFFPWAMAAFHPAHPGRLGTVGGTIGLLRRSPLPAIQLIRLEALESVRSHPSERALHIAEENFQKSALLAEGSMHDAHKALLKEGENLRASVALPGFER